MRIWLLSRLLNVLVVGLWFIFFHSHDFSCAFSWWYINVCRAIPCQPSVMQFVYNSMILKLHFRHWTEAKQREYNKNSQLSLWLCHWPKHRTNNYAGLFELYWHSNSRCLISENFVSTSIALGTRKPDSIMFNIPLFLNIHYAALNDEQWQWELKLPACMVDYNIC